MLLYRILRPIARIALKAYFKQITINGVEHIPKSGGLIICSNHPTGFIEPCLLACYLPRTLHFLVRGDLFDNPLLKHILQGTNQIPIFRFRDGYANMKKNHDMLNLSQKKLSEGEAILIFAEGTTIDVRHVRPFQKGAARMAFSVMKDYPDSDLQMISVGVNYTQTDRFRSCVTINIGKPIDPFLFRESENENKGILNLTRRMEKETGVLLLPKSSEKIEEKLDIYLKSGIQMNPPKSLYIRNIGSKVYREKVSGINAINQDPNLLNSSPEYFEDYKNNALNKYHYLDHKLSLSRVIISAILLLPIMIIMLLNLPPILLGIYMKNKYVRQHEFIGAVMIAASLGAYILYFIALLVISLILYKGNGFMVFLIPILGYLALPGFDYLNKTRDIISLKSKGKSQVVERLINDFRNINSKIVQ